MIFGTACRPRRPTSTLAAAPNAPGLTIKTKAVKVDRLERWISGLAGFSLIDVGWRSQLCRLRRLKRSVCRLGCLGCAGGGSKWVGLVSNHALSRLPQGSVQPKLRPVGV